MVNSKTKFLIFLILLCFSGKLFAKNNLCCTTNNTFQQLNVSDKENFNVYLEKHFKHDEIQNIKKRVRLPQKIIVFSVSQKKHYFYDVQEEKRLNKNYHFNLLSQQKKDVVNQHVEALNIMLNQEILIKNYNDCYYFFYFKSNSFLYKLISKAGTDVWDTSLAKKIMSENQQLLQGYQKNNLENKYWNGPNLRNLSISLNSKPLCYQAHALNFYQNISLLLLKDNFCAATTSLSPAPKNVLNFSFKGPYFEKLIKISI